LEPRWLLAVYLGPRFVEAASVVRILALGIAIAALSGHAGYALAVTGHQRVAFAANALAGLVVVVGGVPAALYGGPEGLAAAALLAILVKYVGEWWLVRRLLGISTHVG
jgi:O-antigen/teichoic acid export membrane protein